MFFSFLAGFLDQQSAIGRKATVPGGSPGERHWFRPSPEKPRQLEEGKKDSKRERRSKEEETSCGILHDTEAD